MSGDQLNLDAKVARYSRIVCPTHGIPDCSPLLNGCTVPAYLNRAGEDVRALVAEVRRLRAKVARVEATVPRAYPGNAIEYGGMVHYVDDDHKTHHPDVTCPCSPTPVWMPRP